MGWQDWMVEGVPKEVTKIIDELDAIGSRRRMGQGVDYKRECESLKAEVTELKTENNRLNKAIINMALKME